MQRFHITWFTDEKKERLTGKTVEAKNISEAIKKVCKTKVDGKTQTIVDVDTIKYVVAL